VPLPRDMVNWEAIDFLPVVKLPEDYVVLDLSSGDWDVPETDFCIGKYDELRPNMYITDLFGGDRNVHIGVDIGGPIGTPCMSFMDGEISHFGYNPDPGDYGNVIITKHEIGGVFFWALFGHLDSPSIEEKFVGQRISAGEIVGHFGSNFENGGWEPHLHFQLSLIEPETHDMPGVVSQEDRGQSLLDYPDPRLVLGPIY